MQVCSGVLRRAQAASGVLNVQLGGTAANEYGRLAVTGSATLDGTLAVELANGFVPTLAQTFPVLTYASRTSSFAQIIDKDPGDGVSYSVAYNATNVTVIATPS